MQFTTAIATLALFLSGSALAQNTEDVTITSLSIHKANAAGTVDGASFKLSGTGGQNIDCSGSATQITAGVPTAEIACGTSPYKFSVLAGSGATSFGLKITHDAISGQGTVGVTCRSGGGQTTVCSQTDAAVKISLKA
ncbi:hypothetical protein F5B19DRAFT_497002 [Rostrohypoxylon terebratum]|nr:hypothetical protein F5B19DRAFT_497002 [Rostrohypoxylon terebratum]